MEKRLCTDVIDQMINIIPKENTQLIQDLQWNHIDASYKAPEETIQWYRTSETLRKHIPNPKENWEFDVLSIFTTEPVDEIKKYFQEDLS